jgi:hypothetical protein
MSRLRPVAKLLVLASVGLFGGADGAWPPKNDYCEGVGPTSDCEAGLLNGKWSAETHEWELCPGNTCRLEDTKGPATIESLRGTLLLFVGDSMLRQIFNGFIHKNIRDMPVVIDPVKIN